MIYQTKCSQFRLLRLNATSHATVAFTLRIYYNLPNTEFVKKYLTYMHLPCKMFFVGPVAQLVRVPACHAGGRGFEPLLGR